MKRLYLLAFLALTAAAQMNDIAGQRIRAHVKFLSSDLLEGRGAAPVQPDVAGLHGFEVRRAETPVKDPDGIEVSLPSA